MYWGSVHLHTSTLSHLELVKQPCVFTSQTLILVWCFIGALSHETDIILALLSPSIYNVAQVMSLKNYCNRRGLFAPPICQTIVCSHLSGAPFGSTPHRGNVARGRHRIASFSKSSYNAKLDTMRPGKLLSLNAYQQAHRALYRKILQAHANSVLRNISAECLRIPCGIW